tara:strand:- start:713 stop:1180 length:468 start_codon:yes stop_codon:yes gene_type:complete
LDSTGFEIFLRKKGQYTRFKEEFRFDWGNDIEDVFGINVPHDLAIKYFKNFCTTYDEIMGKLQSQFLDNPPDWNGRSPTWCEMVHATWWEAEVGLCNELDKLNVVKWLAAAHKTTVLRKMRSVFKEMDISKWDPRTVMGNLDFDRRAEADGIEYK